MLLVLDIGNTEITVGLFRGDRLAASWRMTTVADRTPDEWAATLGAFLAQRGEDPRAVRAAAIASVVPPVTGTVREGVRLATGVEATTVDARSPLPLTLDVDEPFAVGADRVVNVLAAHERYRRDAVVVDFGTATTFDCVTAEGRFIGGSIMPGLRTSADQLIRKAAKLTAAELRPPARAIGRTTEEHIQGGILFGTADAVAGMIRRIAAEWPGGRVPFVVATGGLAGLVAPLCPAIDEVNRDLTLEGLRSAARHLGLTW